MRPLTGSEYQAFRDALVAAYPSYDDLEMMVKFRMSVQMKAIVAPGPLDQVAFQLIQHFEAQGIADRLLTAARASNPGNPQLTAFASPFELSAEPGAFELVVRPQFPFLDVPMWRTQLGEIEGRVCRVELEWPGYRSTGTGFLVGPDVVLTNHHVINRAIPPNPNNVALTFRFDYKRSDDNKIVSQGTEVKPHAQWLICSRPPSAMDRHPDPQPHPPAPNELDYALVRLERPVGREAIGENPDPHAAERGWVKIKGDALDWPHVAMVTIVQHPDGRPLQLAMDVNGTKNVNANGTRVRYTTNTEPGSSGSPCFDLDWKLLALHHSGDRELVPTFNEGIPIPAIHADIVGQGHGHELTAA